MTAAHTLPTPLIVSLHEHAWLTESRHPTSEGLVLYVVCEGCGTRRVDIQSHPLSPPVATSRRTGDR